MGLEIYNFGISHLISGDGKSSDSLFSINHCFNSVRKFHSKYIVLQSIVPTPVWCMYVCDCACV